MGEHSRAVSKFETGSVEQSWQPATFALRGASVPFTTPALAGTRARLGPRGLELVVPHPAGGRGVYILAWSEVADSCAPTVHDTLLIERIAGLRDLSPLSIRTAARDVAIEGAAGPAAQEAARAAQARDVGLVHQTDNVLVQTLVAQVEGEFCPLSELQERGRRCIHRLAASIGCPAALVVSGIEALAQIYAQTGLGDGDLEPACRRTVVKLEQLQGNLAAAAGRYGAAADQAWALVTSALAATLVLARHSLAASTGRIADLPALLQVIAPGGRQAAALLAELANAIWVLDGWQEIGLVWRLAEEAGGQRAGLSEMALMVPAIPKDVQSWGCGEVDETERQRLRRAIRGFEDWRSGSTVFGLIARNERIRAIAA